MAGGAPSARKAGSCRTPPLSAGSWAVARRWRHRARRASVLARGRCGRTSLTAPGPRSLSGNAGVRKGASAGAVAGQGPSAQVSAGHPQIRVQPSSPGGSWPCRDHHAPLAEQLSVRLAGGRGRCRGFLEVSHNGTWGRVCANGTSPSTATTVCRQLGCGHQGWLSAVPAQQPAPAWLAWVGCEDGARSLWGCPSAPWNLQSCGPGGDAHVDCDGDSDDITETDTTPHPDGATSTGSSARAGTPNAGLAGIPLCSLPGCIHTGVPGSTAAAVTTGTVPVPTVLCVVLGTLLCLALGALAVLLCRARAWRRGGSWRVGAGTDLVWAFRGSRPAEQLRRWAGVPPVPPTVARAPGKCCLSFQALAELQMPSPTLSMRSWTTPQCRSTRRCPVAQVGAAPVPQLCPERGLCPTSSLQLRVLVAWQWLLARGRGCPSVRRQPRCVV